MYQRSSLPPGVIRPDGGGDDVAYLNNAGFTPLPPAVVEAGVRSVDTNPWLADGRVDRANEERIRRQFSAIVGGVDGTEVAILPSTAYAVTMAAHNLHRTGRIRPGSTVLLLQDQFDSAVYPWQEISDGMGTEAEGGLRLEFVPYPDGDGDGDGDGDAGGCRCWTELILDRLNDCGTDYSVACLPQVHWADGTVLDLPSIGRACRRRGVALVVDATQSAGVMPGLSVSDIQPDMLCASVHKWLLGPHGMSLCWVRPDHHGTWLPLDQHGREREWGSGKGGGQDGREHAVYEASRNKLRNGTDAEGAGYPTDFVASVGAARLDSGGYKSPVLLAMVRASLDLVMGQDVGSLQEELVAVSRRIAEGAKKLGLTVSAGPRCGHILGLRPGPPELRAEFTPERMVDIVANLQSRGVYIAARCGVFRVSPYLGVEEGQIEMLLKGLRDELLREDEEGEGWVML